jgi:hypothetical protein
MSDVNLILDKIREELEKGLPSKRKILSYLLDGLKKDKYPFLSDFDFYDIVGETYKLNLDYKLNLNMLFFPVYNALKKKIKRLYGKEKTLEMEKYLIDKFGLSYPEKSLFVAKKVEGGLSTKSKIFLIASIICSLICGFITIGLAMNPIAILVAFIAGFFVPSIAFICDRIFGPN